MLADYSLVLQIHLTYNGGTNVTVSWATGEGIVTAAPVPSYAADEAGPGNMVWYGTTSGNYTTNVTSTTITHYTQVSSLMLCHEYISGWRCDRQFSCNAADGILQLF